MFDFERFPVYLKSEEYYKYVLDYIQLAKLDKCIVDQIKRASLSIVLNIAEGAGKYSKNDKKNFYVIARWSVYECVAILRILKIEKKIDNKTFSDLYEYLFVIGKMLSWLISSMMKK